MREANEEWAAYVAAIVAERFTGKQAALAASLDVSPSTVNRWLAGATPQIAQVQHLAESLDIPVVDVLVAAGIDRASLVPAGDGDRVPTDVLTAIEHDIELLDEARNHLRQQYQLLKRLGPELSEPSRRKPPARTIGRPGRLRAVAHGGDPKHADYIDEQARLVREQYERDQRERIEREKRDGGDDQ